MTDTSIALIVNAASIIAFNFFQGWKAEQALKKQALDIQDQAKANAERLAEKTDRAAMLLAEKTDRAAQEVKDAHDSLLAAQIENTKLTIIGNGVKEQMLDMQKVTAENQKDISDLKETKMNGG